MPIFKMNISLVIFKFPAPFSHNTVTHEVFPVYSTHSMIYFCCIIPFCLKKTNDASQLTLGGTINKRGHVCEPTAQPYSCDVLELAVAYSMVGKMRYRAMSSFAFYLLTGHFSVELEVEKKLHSYMSGLRQCPNPT